LGTYREAPPVPAISGSRSTEPPFNTTQAVLDFLSTTDVGRLVPAKEDVGSEVSEWELRERRERKEERRVEAEELGAGVELPLFLHTPSFMASADEEQGTGCLSFGSFLCDLLGAHLFFLGTGVGGRFWASWMLRPEWLVWWLAWLLEFVGLGTQLP